MPLSRVNSDAKLPVQETSPHLCSAHDRFHTTYCPFLDRCVVNGFTMVGYKEVYDPFKIDADGLGRDLIFEKETVLPCPTVSQLVSRTEVAQQGQEPLLNCILVSGLQHWLCATCRVFSCCNWKESVDCDLESPVQESSPSQVSTQPWGWNGEAIRELHLHLTHDYFRTLPLFPWTDTQAD